MKKSLSLLVVLMLLCMSLSGCVGISGELKINENAGGTFSIFNGYSEAGCRAYLDANGEEYTEEEFQEELQQSEFEEINGVKYYGESSEFEFKNPDEFNYNIQEDANSVINRFKLEQNDDGTVKLALAFNEFTGKNNSVSRTGDPETDEKFAKLMENEYVVLFDIEFPGNIVKTAGADVSGLSIDGNKLHVNMLEVVKELENGSEVFTFETLKDGDTAESKMIKFSDVSKEEWFYKPVMTLAAGGVVKGVGGGKFLPNDYITYAQFCSMLARVERMDLSGEYDYWAYKEIEYYVNDGIINDLGEITPENYDVPIPREVAIAAIARMYYPADDMDLVEGEFIITKENIPDYAAISDEYKEDILSAYIFGITNGKDASMTFDPKGVLTRAEVCQLFYNIGQVLSY